MEKSTRGSTKIDSAISTLLTNNYNPSDMQRSHVTELLTQASLELKQVETLIAELNQKRSAILDRIGVYKLILSPARYLPRDILHEIFVRCLPTRHNAIMSASEAPLVLGRVCSSWRKIAFSTPALWSSVHISVPAKIPQDYTDGQDSIPSAVVSLEEAVSDWLCRSNPLPLSISLFFPSQQASQFVELLCGPLDATVPSFNARMATRILPFSSRLQRVHFDADLECLEPILTRSADKFPILQELALGKGNFDGIWPSLLIDFLKIQNIRKLFMPKSFTLPSTPAPEICWAQLTHISITILWRNGQGPLDFFADCPNAEVLSLCITASLEFDGFDIPDELNAWDVDRPRRMIDLLSLHTLNIRDSLVHEISSSLMLANLHLPQIRSLSIDGAGHQGETKVLEDLYFEHSITPGISFLESLRCSYESASVPMLFESLRSNPGIKTLHLIERQYSNWECIPFDGLDVDIERGLLWDENSPNRVCPALEVLQLQGYFTGFNVFFDLIESRSGKTESGAAKLVRLHLIIENSISQEDEADLSLLLSTYPFISARKCQSSPEEPVFQNRIGIPLSVEGCYAGRYPDVSGEDLEWVA